MGRHTRFKERSLDEFQSAARTHVRVMNAALADVPAQRMRMHVCWGVRSQRSPLLLLLTLEHAWSREPPSMVRARALAKGPFGFRS